MCIHTIHTHAEVFPALHHYIKARTDGKLMAHYYYCVHVHVQVERTVSNRIAHP